MAYSRNGLQVPRVCDREITYPQLFALFINDLAREEKKGTQIDDIIQNLLLYSDDIAIISDCAMHMQEILDTVSQWCTKWRLSINIKKKINGLTRLNVNLSFNSLYILINDSKYSNQKTGVTQFKNSFKRSRFKFPCGNEFFRQSLPVSVHQLSKQYLHFCVNLFFHDKLLLNIYIPHCIVECSC